MTPRRKISPVKGWETKIRPGLSEWCKKTGLVGLSMVDRPSDAWGDKEEPEALEAITMTKKTSKDINKIEVADQNRKQRPIVKQSSRKTKKLKSGGWGRKWRLI